MTKPANPAQANARRNALRLEIRQRAPDLADFINLLREKFGAVGVGQVKFFEQPTQLVERY